MEFNWLDYVFIAIFFFSALAGFGRGLIREVMGLAALVVACFAATMYANELALSFTSAPAVQSVVNDASSATGINAAQPVSYVAIGVAFGLIFAGTYLVGVIVAFFVNLAFSFGVLGIGNRIFGGVFGLCRAALINLVLIFMIQLTAASNQVWWKKSVVVQEYQPYVAMLGGYVSPTINMLKQKAGESLQGLDSKVKSITQ
jgi:membrane protein required for colicin V production